MTKDMDAETLAALKELLAMVEAGDRSAWVIKSAATHALGGYHADLARRAYIGSLDAAKALDEALLPGWPARLHDETPESCGARGWVARVNWPHRLWQSTFTVRGPFSFEGRADDPARAWLIAQIKGVIWKAEQ